jgi:hypothetical protein
VAGKAPWDSLTALIGVVAGFDAVQVVPQQRLAQLEHFEDPLV